MNILHICPTYKDQRCGIGKYTNYLVEGLKKLTPKVEQNILPEGFQSINQVLITYKPDVCHVQLEYGFTSAQRLALLDEYCQKYGTRLVITFHSLAQISHNVAAPHALQLAHTDLCQNYGKFVVIKQGVPIVKANKPVGKINEQQGKVLDTTPYLFFGQAHPHKQLFELLQLVKETRDSLCCVVSKPVQGDTSYYDKCFEFSKEIPHVCWFDEYLEDKEVLGISHYCKAALFPYVEYGAIGISAAVKLLLNNPNLPIFTTYASHFSDFPDKTLTITKLHRLEDMLNVPPFTDTVARGIWVHHHNFDQVAKEHKKLYDNLTRN